VRPRVGQHDMLTRVEKDHSAQIEPAQVHQALEQVLTSKYFVNAHKKKGFLRLICDLYLDGRAHEVNEYRIAFDVFGRDNNYNPSADPIVRVVAHEIRKKLELYYQNEGADDEIRLEIPAGSYQPIFTRLTPPAPPEIVESVDVPQAPPDTATTSGDDTIPAQTAREPKRRMTVAIMLGATALVLAIAVAVLGYSNWELRNRFTGLEASGSQTIDTLLWTHFVQDATPPLVILSNPPVLGFVNPSDPDVVVKESIPLTPQQVDALRSRFVVTPEVIVTESPAAGGVAPAETESRVLRQNEARLIARTNVCTGMGEAIGLHYLTDFFRTAGRSIQLKQSRTLSAEDLKNHNVIMLGGVWVNGWTGKLTSLEDFVFTDNGTIVNHKPQPGEQSEYIPQFDGRTGSLVVDYALITVRPNLSSAHEVMVLAGALSPGTEAAAEYVTNKSYLSQLNQRLRQLRPDGEAPIYFQALLRVGVENGIPTTITLQSLHEIHP
jgi:hypothetical protein